MTTSDRGQLLTRTLIGAAVGVALASLGETRQVSSGATLADDTLSRLLPFAVGGATTGALTMLLKSRKPRGAVRQYLAWIGIATCGTLAMFANDAVRERSLQPLGLALVFGVLCGTALASIARRKSEIDGSEM